MVIGLTGYSGAGKSAAAQIFGALGAYIIDTDGLARRVVEPGRPALAEICRAFGQGVINPDGTLHRRALGQLVFTDAKKRKRLEEITHPYIVQETREELRKIGGRDVVIDAPVLFEVPEIVSMCEKKVFIDADPALRIRRIMERDGISEQEARQRTGAQAFMESWKNQCDLVIENNGNLDRLQEAVQSWMEVQRGRRR